MLQQFYLPSGPSGKRYTCASTSMMYWKKHINNYDIFPTCQLIFPFMDPQCNLLFYLHLSAGVRKLSYHLGIICSSLVITQKCYLWLNIKLLKDLSDLNEGLCAVSCLHLIFKTSILYDPIGIYTRLHEYTPPPMNARTQTLLVCALLRD